ncbi:MAG: hypothetical protein J7M18_04160, partial [Candidatus Eremiobacteraeota bacterium]|nr:hypothetical protein [Candidatus Eremiobacteraeota bacterium]
MERWITKIGDIIDAPEKFIDHGNLILHGTCRGWSREEGLAVEHGPPVTRSDWILKDETGAIYIHGAIRFYPEHLHPAEDLDVDVLLTGQVIMSETE